MPSWCTRVLAGAVVILTLDPGSASQPAPGERAITVSEGTSMAAAVSPDGTQVVVDLQGSLWIIPRAGGAATRITDALHDARQPSWAPSGKTIAFQSYRDGTWDLWTIGADGTGARAVTTGPFDDREPHWSPDGARLAFSSDRSGNYDVWVVDLTTGTVQQITRDEGNDYWPAWSPDGRDIAFVAERQDGAGIRAVSLDGTDRLIVASTARLGAPAWTPDGHGVVFSALSGGATRLMMNDRELSATEDVFPFRPQWTSKDSFIYTADGRIKERWPGDAGASPRVVSFDATLGVRLADYTPRRRSFDETTRQRVRGIVRPGLSPDGRQVVFSALGDVWTSRGAGVPTRITSDAGVETDPAWSPDGTRIAYASDRLGSFDVFVRDLATGNEQRLTSTPTAELRPTWSPDGTRVAFVTVGGLVGGQLSVVHLGTRAVQSVLGERIGPINPGWSPDGRTLFASVLRTYSSRYREGVNQVIAVPLDGGDPRPITLVADVSTGKGGEGPAWAPDGRHVALVIDGDLFVVPLSAAGEPSGPARLMATGPADQVSWAADSKHVLFSAGDRVAIAAIDGGSRREWPIDLTYVRHVPAGSVVIHAGRLVDGVTDAARENIDIVIAGHRIARVVPHADREHGGRVVDASALTVMPGLIEAHGHYSPEFGRAFDRLHLAYGITSVRSPGGPPYASVAQRETIEAGARPGPRLFATGYVIDGTRVYYPIAAPSPTGAAIDRELERARVLEFDLLKTYVRLPDALQRRAIEGAHRLGIPVSSHEVYPAAAFGIDSVEHLSATSRRGYSPKVSLIGRAYEDVRRIVSASGMTITPTLALGAARRVIDATPDIRTDARWQLQPEWVRGSFARPGPASGAAATQTRENLFAYHQAGARIIAGTDSPLVPYGIALHIELEEYVAAGLTPLEALRTATINVARALRVEGDLGTVEPGKLADLAIVEGNPLADIRATRRVRLVVANGEVHTLEQLLK